jgi:hypothetical protein
VTAESGASSVAWPAIHAAVMEIAVNTPGIVRTAPVLVLMGATWAVLSANAQAETRTAAMMTEARAVGPSVQAASRAERSASRPARYDNNNAYGPFAIAPGRVAAQADTPQEAIDPSSDPAPAGPRPTRSRGLADWTQLPATMLIVTRVVDAMGAPIGEIAYLQLGQGDGVIHFAAVRLPGQGVTKAVPWTRLHYQPEQRGYAFEGRLDDLRAAPEAVVDVDVSYPEWDASIVAYWADR